MAHMMNDRCAEILLIYPGVRVAKPRLPMSVLALASHCIPHSYTCKIVDERVSEVTDNDIKDAAIIGISTMSGVQLKCAIRTASRIRKMRPDVPLIWGGVHPTSFPEQTAQSPLVDVVVKAEGEDVFVKLCDRVFHRQDYSDVPAITFRRDGRLIDNPMADEWMDMDQLHPVSYGLLDINKYADADDGLSYESSRGCAFRCAFCYVEGFHKRKWRGKSADKVISELKKIQTEYGVRKVFFIEDNFFGNKKRCLEICDMMISSGISLDWSATVRADILSRCCDEDMDRIRKSGCKILVIGGESGSERILKQINKDITPGQIKATVRKCVSHNIMPTVSFMTGLPFEEDVDLEKTLELYDELMALGKNVEVNSLNIYTPYAGTPLFETAIECGYEPKKDLAAWSDWNFNDSRNNPWLTSAMRKKAETISSIARFKYMRHRFESYSDEYRKHKLKSLLLRLGYFLFVRLFAASADFRWKHRAFRFALEWRLWAKCTYLVFKVR